MTSQMTIGKKLFGSFGGSLLLTVTVGGTAIWLISNLGSSMDKAVNINAQKQFLAAQSDKHESDMVAAERGILLRTLTKEPALVAKYNQDFLDAAAQMKSNIDAFKPLIENDSERGILGTIETDRDAAIRNHQDFYQLVTAGKDTEAGAFLKDKVIPGLDAISLQTVALKQAEGTMMASAVKVSSGQVSLGHWVTIIMLILSVVVGVVIVMVVRQINASLRQVIGNLSEGAGQVASAAGQISSSSQQLAQGASEQAASLEETSASSEEINSMARKNAENSQAANGLMNQSQQKITETNQSLESMVVAMGDIKASSDKVAKIIKVIDEIAFQTNILALNAAVEAARAGEAGMGFAVVADEVRNLAQRCAQAAKDTAELIEESIAKSNDGKTKVDQVAVAIRAITEESAKVKTLVDEVTLGSQEQTRGIEQVAKALTQMEQVTQQSAANAEESAAAAEELTAQSANLMEVVHHLSTMVGGGDQEEKNRSARPAWKADHTMSHLHPPVAAAQKMHTPRPGAKADPIPMEADFKAMA